MSYLTFYHVLRVENSFSWRERTLNLYLYFCPLFESLYLSTQMVLCSAVRLFRRARKDATLGEVSFLLRVCTVKVEYFTGKFGSSASFSCPFKVMQGNSFGSILTAKCGKRS